MHSMEYITYSKSLTPACAPATETAHFYFGTLVLAGVKVISSPTGQARKTIRDGLDVIKMYFNEVSVMLLVRHVMLWWQASLYERDPKMFFGTHSS